MIFTAKVNRLEYITRMGFDNTDEEKKQLMNYFSKLDRAAILGTDELTALREENAELVKALELSLELSLELINCAAMRGQTPGCWSFAERDEARKMGEVAISKHKG